MTSSVFNAITYATNLKNAGLDVKVADVEAEQISTLVNEQLVTKDHMSDQLKLLEMRLQAFFIKSLIATIAVLSALQSLIHFVK